MAGSVILCIGAGVDTSSIQRNGSIGIIVALDRAFVRPIDNSSLIAALVDYESGTRIIDYFYSSRYRTHIQRKIIMQSMIFISMIGRQTLVQDSPVNIGPSTTQIGKPFSTEISFFSSRGPNTTAPVILKVKSIFFKVLILIPVQFVSY